MHLERHDELLVGEVEALDHVPTEGPWRVELGVGAFDRLGHGKGIGDVDGDGHADFMATRWGASRNGYQCGAVRVYSGADASVLLEIDGLAAGDVLGRGGPNTANSTGQPGTMIGIGSTLAAANDLTLRAESLPHYQWGYFLTSRQQGFVLFPGGSQGALCLGGQIGRFLSQVQNSGSQGAVTVPVDLTRMPLTPNVAVQAGETWRFQFWHRDVLGAPTSNFTEALAVTFD